MFSASELELLKTAICHIRDNVDEIQSDHKWCDKLNEAIEKSYIPIPKIQLKDGNPFKMSLSINSIGMVDGESKIVFYSSGPKEVYFNLYKQTDLKIIVNDPSVIVFIFIESVESNTYLTYVVWQ